MKGWSFLFSIGGQCPPYYLLFNILQLRFVDTRLVRLYIRNVFEIVMKDYYQDFLIRSWSERDRQSASQVIRSVLSEYGLGWEPKGADRDVLQVEECYLATWGEFWVIEHQNQVVGTGAYYPIKRGKNAV